MTGILFALTAALLWGSGDFSGGFATRKANPFQVLALSAIAGVVVLAIAALVAQETLPPGDGHSLVASGRASPVLLASPRSTLPSPAGTPPRWRPSRPSSAPPSRLGSPLLSRGSPAALQLVGFALAFVGIWLVSRSAPVDGQKDQFPPGAGLPGRGWFWRLFHFHRSGGKRRGFSFPLLFARGVMFLGALLLLAVKRLPLPSIRANPIAPLAGVLDAAGQCILSVGNHLFPAWILPWSFPPCIRQSPYSWQHYCLRKRLAIGKKPAWSSAWQPFY